MSYWGRNSLLFLGTVVSEKEDPLSRRIGRPKSEFKFFRRVLCVIGFINSLGTVVAEEDDPPSRRVGRPKSEFKFVRHCVLCIIWVINIL